MLAFLSSSVVSGVFATSVVKISMNMCDESILADSRLSPHAVFSHALTGVKFFEHGGDFERKTIHSSAQILDAVQEMVVGDHGGNGGEESRGRGDQRFGNAGRDGA